ncbi:DUF4373 domain-containing protein [candidate division KSB1 bacterium]|nr:DUF4373 domain-containing protein [candidate division KSB1 bacterium]
MKWYKHDANANCDAKLRHVRLKYGMEGYGLYWYCLELIAQNVERHNLSFELEHDAEIISADVGIHFELVQEMMMFMVDLGLFERSNGVITCLKLASRTDEYTQKLLRSMPNVPTISRQCPDKVPPNRIEQKKTRTEETTTAPEVPAEFAEFKKAYPQRSGAQPWAKALRTIRARLKEGAQWADLLEGAHRYAAYCAATDRIGTEYILQAATFCGPEKHYLELWKPPATKSVRLQDKNIAAGQAYLDSANGQ